jgi:hypothetical protein
MATQPTPPVTTTTTQTQTPPPVQPPCPCTGFYCWLQAWASPGGNIILLAMLTVFLISATVYMMRAWGPAAPAVMFVVPIAGGFAVAVTTRMGISQASSSTTTTRTPDQH